MLDRGAVASEELDLLIRENQASLSALLANLITIGPVTTARVDGIEQLLVTYPDVIAGGYTVVPGDGTALRLALSEEPKVQAGLRATKRTDPNRTTNLPAVNTGAVHTARLGGTVRGAQNAPAPRGPAPPARRPAGDRRAARTAPGRLRVVGHGSTRRLGAPPHPGR